MPEHCEARGRPFLSATSTDKPFTVIFRPRCKSWGCPYCAEINKKLWALRGAHGAGELIAEGRAVKFVTLTSHEKLNPNGTLIVWPKAWKKLHARAKYKGGKQPYLMIPERHKDNRLHQHMLTAWDMSETWWKDNARAVGLGYMAKVKPVKSGPLAAWYVTKYLVKSLDTIDWPTKFRRIRTSQDWPKLPETEKPAEWSFAPLSEREPLDIAIKNLERAGRTVFVVDNDTAWNVIGAIDNDGEFSTDVV